MKHLEVISKLLIIANDTIMFRFDARFIEPREGCTGIDMTLSHSSYSAASLAPRFRFPPACLAKTGARKFPV
jgi:hypothetical protein